MPWIPPVTMSAEEVAAMAQTLRGLPPSIVITPVLMGMIIDSVFLGIMASQMLNWFSHSRKDEPRYIQLACLYAAVMGLGVWILSVCWVMNLFGFNYGRWTQWNDNRWLSWYPLMDAGMVIVVQCFYAERAYKIAGRVKAVIILVVLPLSLSLIGAIGIVVCGMTKNEIDQRYNNFGWMWIVGTFVADMVITVIVLHGLIRQRSDWEQTDTIVKRLIRVACESQLPPTAVALALLIDFAIQGDTYYAVFFEMIQGKLYVVGMLYVLNSRYFMRRDIDEGVVSFAQRPGTFTMNPRSRILGPATIHVQTETYVESHQINTAFVQQKITPKLREPSDSGETDLGSTFGTSNEGDNANQSEIGLNSAYMERVNQARKKGEFSLASFAAMG